MVCNKLKIAQESSLFNTVCLFNNKPVRSLFLLGRGGGNLKFDENSVLFITFITFFVEYVLLSYAFMKKKKTKKK